MIDQLPLEFDGPERARECWLRVLERLRSGIAATGGIREWAYKLDASPTLLSDALHERDRKHVQARWLVVLLVALPEPHRKALLEEMATLAGYEITPRRKLTDSERLARLEEAVRTELGQAGAALIKRVGR